MALITDPDSLNQGNLTNVTDLAFTASSHPDTTLTSTGNLPALADNEWFEIRNANTPANNGLYRVKDTSPTTSAVDCEKFSGGTVVNDSAQSTDVLGTTGAASAKSVHFDTEGLEIFLFEQGNLSSDGTTMLALHSFAKEEWKATDNYLMARADFPFVGISFAAGQWQVGADPSGNFSGWNFADDITAETQVTRKLIRAAGWDALDSSGNTIEKWFNVTTLGTFEDTGADQAYYWYGTDNTDTGAAVDYEYAGPVNEPVQYFYEVDVSGDTPSFATSSTITRTTGSFITDGWQIGGQVSVRDSTSNDSAYVLTNVEALTLTVTGTPLSVEAWGTTVIAVDNSNAFNTALRIRDADPEGKTFDQSDLTSAGETEVTSKIIKFPLANATDLDVTETDANITNSPYSEVRIRYLAGAYNREVDTTTKRNFGIVIDCGTYSNSNGSTSTSAPHLTSASFTAGVGEATTDYTGGDLIIHEGSDQGTHTISNITDNAGTLEITVNPALSTGSETNQSFTVQRATPLNVDKNDIYEKVQYQLRQASDINENATLVVVGKTADELLNFVGPTLKAGLAAPTNPAGGGTGVAIEGFDPNDTNDLELFDAGGTGREFPFVAAGNLVFNQGLVTDTDGEYWLFFEYTSRTTNSDIDVTTPSGDSYTLTGTLPNMAVNDYIQISGFAQDENNGLFIIEVENTPSASYDVRKVDGSDVGTVETDQTVNIDENPYPSPDAIIVDDNDDADIAGAIGATTVAFTFDYDNNVQGGRTAASDANVVLVAAGLENAQVAVVTGLVISESTGLTFSLTSPQERNYLNE